MTDDYDLRVEQHDGYVYASVASATDGRKKTERYISEIAAKCRDGGCPKLLIEKHVDGSFWLWDSMSVADHLQEFAVDNLKVAIVDRTGEHFGEDGFAVQEGSRVCAHVFRNLETARAWLLSDDTTIH